MTSSPSSTTFCYDVHRLLKSRNGTIGNACARHVCANGQLMCCLSLRLNHFIIDTMQYLLHNIFFLEITRNKNAHAPFLKVVCTLRLYSLQISGQ